MDVRRFDFNGTSVEFKRTAQGFLRVNARLTKTGVFSYDSGREYRCEEEVFRADSLASIKGAPVTDRHPSQKSAYSFLTPANAKSHIIGITEGVELDGPYLKGSLIIFHEDAIKAIESGERKEISLGYRCLLEPTPGAVNGEAYDAIQRDIVVNHVAIGPKGSGRAGLLKFLCTSLQTRRRLGPRGLVQRWNRQYDPSPTYCLLRYGPFWLAQQIVFRGSTSSPLRITARMLRCLRFVAFALPRATQDSLHDGSDSSFQRLSINGNF